MSEPRTESLDGEPRNGESLVAGVDLGGTNTSAALVTEGGEVVAEASMPTSGTDGPERVLERIGDLVAGLFADRARPRALGIGCPGWVDARRGTTRWLPNLPGHWPQVPVAAQLGRRLGLPVHLINDARAATLAELHFGAGRGARTFVLLTLGTGIGGGVVIDGRLRLDDWGVAGELGHQVVEPSGPRCGCGGRGCLEAVASGPALAGEGVRLLRSGQAPHLFALVEGDVRRVDAETMGRAAEAGDAAVREAIERAAFYLGLGVVNVVVALHPEAIVLTGGMAALAPQLVTTIERTVAERVRVFSPERVRILTSELHGRAGVLGAAALARAGGSSELSK